MRIRQVKPEYWKHEGLGDVSIHARLLFIGLWAIADCAGRLKDQPKTIKAEVFPYDTFDADQVDIYLDELAAHPEEFITRYEVDGKKYIQINSFLKHQRLMGNESKAISRYPEKPLVTTSNYQLLPSNHHTEETDNGVTEERKNGETESEFSPEANSFALAAMQYLKNSNNPNLQNIGWATGFLKIQFTEIHNSRPDIPAKALLEIWQECCDDASSRNISASKWYRTAFMNKVNEWQPGQKAKPKTGGLLGNQIAKAEDREYRSGKL